MSGFLCIGAKLYTIRNNISHFMSPKRIFLHIASIIAVFAVLFSVESMFTSPASGVVHISKGERAVENVKATTTIEKVPREPYRVSAESYLVIDIDTGKIYAEKES